MLDVGGEACLFDESGMPLKGFTNVQSEFTVALGKPAKRLWILPSGTEGKRIVLWADAGANDLFGCKPENGLFIQAGFVRFRKEMRALYYDLECLAYYADAVGSKEAEAVFHEGCALWSTRPGEASRLVRGFLKEEPERTDGNTVFALGHAHLDLAWLWPVRETKRKAVRTLATVAYHMDRDPEYRFCVSQPQMLKWVKEQYPRLYEKVKTLWGEGKIEAVGGSWVEMDTNLPDGESLARQMVYGQRFWKEECGKCPEILWLPDTFGYSAQLPQLMKQAGMPYFLTTKLSWNSVNKFPYRSFWWQGIDGTRVLTHLPPEGNYNSAARPDSVRKAECSKEEGGCSVLLFGIGDGGGGPGAEHLERLKREKALPGMPAVRQAFAREFYSRLEKEGDRLPVWKGELYLEKHQGTYTTQGRTKRNNRMCEKALHELEFLGSVALRLCPGFKWEADEVRSIWETVLLYQFHDILPGSAIDRVYRETGRSYGELLDRIRTLKTKVLDALRGAPGSGDGKSLLNASPVSNGEPVRTEGWKRPQTPALPYCFTPFLPGDASGSICGEDGGLLENDCLRVRFSGNGALSSVFHKETGKEFLAGESNRLLVYEDTCDGWEVPDAKGGAVPDELRPESVTSGRDGDTVFRLSRYRFRDSVILQKAILRAGSARIEFETEADWKEQHTLLRAEFRPSVRSEEVLCGVPFGELTRPTMHRDSWEAAKREVCFQGYADLSDGQSGAALLSDCKYGLDVRDCVLSLALLRTPVYPAEHADLGKHVFRYAFLPHDGGTEAVQPEAARMRAEPECVSFTGPLTEPFVRAEGLTVQTVKPAEDGDGIVVRMYNPGPEKGRTKILAAPCLGFTSCFRTSLLESDERALPLGGEFAYGPFEIITIRLR